MMIDECTCTLEDDYHLFHAMHSLKTFSKWNPVVELNNMHIHNILVR